MGFKKLSTNKDYFYLKNLQGDIIKIIDENKNVVASYEYDDWGKLTTSESSLSSVGQLNPFRYRGYYYDSETSLYYLNSRYYDPETGRFINADALVYTDPKLSGHNMFTYCDDNPINKIDPMGNAPKWWQSILIGMAIIAVSAISTAAIFASGGGAAAIISMAGKIVVGAGKAALLTGTVAGTIRASKSYAKGNTNDEIGRDFVTGFADGFLGTSAYSAGYVVGSAISYGLSGMFNNGNGWSSGKWEGGYQTPSTPGVSLATHHGGTNGGRSFGIDMDIYNGIHYHTNKFGFGKKSNWIKAHHWELVPIITGISIGLSDPWSEW